MEDIINRLNKFKKDFVETDLSNYKNKIVMFDELCNIELDLKLLDLTTAARRSCEVDG